MRKSIHMKVIIKYPPSFPKLIKINRSILNKLLINIEQ